MGSQMHQVHASHVQYYCYSTCYSRVTIIERVVSLYCHYNYMYRYIYLVSL